MSRPEAGPLPVGLFQDGESRREDLQKERHMKAGRSPRVSRNRRKTGASLASLRSAEVVRAIVAHPRRLDELISLIESSERIIRDRAAANLARLAQSHPGRLLRVIERLKQDLTADSAYVRWN